MRPLTGYGALRFAGPPRARLGCPVRVCVRACVLCFVFGGVFGVSCFRLVVWRSCRFAGLPFRCPLLRVVLGSVASGVRLALCRLFVAGFGRAAVVAVPCRPSCRSPFAAVGSAVVPAWLPAVVRRGAVGCLGRLGSRLRAVVASVVSASRAAVAFSRLRLLACLPSGGLFFYACRTTKATDESLVA